MKDYDRKEGLYENQNAYTSALTWFIEAAIIDHQDQVGGREIEKRSCEPYFQESSTARRPERK